MQTYLLDACALIVYLGGEDGSLAAKELLDQAYRREVTLSINAVNLIEIYYDRYWYRIYGGAVYGRENQN